ncbi:MAG TPA: hypothetical protein VGG12_01270 [Methylovirgula sp.]
MSLVDFRKPMRGSAPRAEIMTRTLLLPPVNLPGLLRVPQSAKALIAFVHARPSSAANPRNRAVAQALNLAGFATLQCDLLADEEAGESGGVEPARLAERLHAICRALDSFEDVHHLPLGILAANAGAGIAYRVAQRSRRVASIVARGDVQALSEGFEAVNVPTLLILGARDPSVSSGGSSFASVASGRRAIEVIPNASSLFTEPGALTAVAAHAGRWFERHLVSNGAPLVQFRHA